MTPRWSIIHTMLKTREKVSSTIPSTSRLNVIDTQHPLRLNFVNKRIKGSSTQWNCTAIYSPKCCWLNQPLRQSAITVRLSHNQNNFLSEKIMQVHLLRRLSIIKTLTPSKRTFAAILKHQFHTNNLFIPTTVTKQSYLYFEIIICG